MGIPNRSKIPLRGIGKLFTQLPSGIRAKLEAAFQEAESQINYHNRSTLNSQERRRLSSYVSAPVITLTQNSRGFEVSWPRLDDRLISFYEAQVSLTSNFADVSTYNISEVSLAVEGVGSTVYVRVRGVRWDGDTGAWSNVVVMDSTTGGPITYSRGMDDVEPFYIADPGRPFPGPLQRLEITPQRQNGGIMIFGSIAAREYTSAGDPTVIVTLNGVTVSSISQANFGDTGGSGCGLGPVFVSHNSFYFGDSEEHFPISRTTTGSGSSSGTHTPWTSADPTVYQIEWGAGAGPRDAQTSNVQFAQYGFSIPLANTVVGIQVDYTATDNNFNTGTYDSADIIGLRLLDAGTARGNKVTNSDWGNSVKTWGGRTDLWGEADGYWTPSKINDAGFGVLLRGRMFAPASASTRIISATWPKITVYSTNETTGEVDIQVRLNVVPGTGTLLACTLNAIEFGDAI